MSQRSLGSVHDRAARRRTFYIAGRADQRQPASLCRDRDQTTHAPPFTCVDVPRQLQGATNSDRPRSGAPQEVRFGPFRLLPTERLLLEGETPVRLGSRALDILVALLERPGELVSKHELITRVWPDTFVDDGNLKVHIAGLRRALADRRGGNRYIATIAGRGYCFVAPVKRAPGFWPATPPLIATEGSHNLPVPLTRLIGRDDIVAKLQAQLLDQRLITVVGMGGVGKTSLALAVARGLVARYEHGVWLVDLTTISDPSLAPIALASAIGVELPCGDLIPRFISFLRDKQMLLVLDNCEHVIEGAASMALRALKGAPNVQIIATSREPLRIESELAHRLSPLEFPAGRLHLSTSALLEYPAIQLFLERATSTLGSFELAEDDVPLVIDICRKLDGIPLAIEGAASAVEAIGIRGVAAHLDKSLWLPATYRRMTPSRHRSFQATLDWSYRLLSEKEQMAFRRLGVFSGRFSLEAAAFITADAKHPPSEMVDHVAALVTKSLVTADLGEKEPRFRLLATICAYALERLGESGEEAAVMRRDAERRQCLLKLAA